MYQAGQVLVQYRRRVVYMYLYRYEYMYEYGRGGEVTWK